MPRKKPLPLSVLTEKFHETNTERKIMFRKRYYVFRLWNIGQGMIVQLDKVHPEFLELCRYLFHQDSEMFEGDIEYLLNCPLPPKPKSYCWYRSPYADR